MTSRPVFVAYFEVHTPFRQGVYHKDVEAEVDRFLYAGFERVSSPSTPPEEADGYWTTSIRFEWWGVTVSGGRDLLQGQRDRFSSGLHGTTEPTIYYSKDNA